MDTNQVPLIPIRHKIVKIIGFIKRRAKRCPHQRQFQKKGGGKKEMENKEKTGLKEVFLKHSFIMVFIYFTQETKGGNLGHLFRISYVHRSTSKLMPIR